MALHRSRGLVATGQGAPPERNAKPYISIWRVDDCVEVGRICRYGGSVDCLAFDSSGEILFSYGADLSWYCDDGRSEGRVFRAWAVGSEVLSRAGTGEQRDEPARLVTRSTLPTT